MLAAICAVVIAWWLSTVPLVTPFAHFVSAIPTTVAVVAGAAAVFWVRIAVNELLESKVLTEKKIEQIEVKAEKEPEKTRFAWDLARVKLEAYFDRNLYQVQMIFLVAVAVMVVGFIFIMWGVSHAVSKPESIKTSYLAAISGIITEFIGVTFMVIYRSTMSQANQFMDVLERINTVGMAVQILDAIPEADAELKNKTRAEIVSLLLSANTGRKAAEVKQSRSKSGAPKTDLDNCTASFLWPGGSYVHRIQ